VEGKASVETSRKVYCVSIDPQTLEIDFDETKRLRENEKKDRIERGVPGWQFIKDLVKRRKEKDLPDVVLSFLEETMAFSPAYKKEIEQEEEIIKSDLKALGMRNIKKILFELTPNVNIGLTEGGKEVTFCSQCGFVFNESSKNYKLYCLIYERDPAEIYPSSHPADRLAPDKDWCVLREFYCPNCGAQIEVEATPPGTPILQSYFL